MSETLIIEIMKTAAIVIAFLFGYVFIKRVHKKHITMSYMKDFASYIGVLEYHMQKAYDIIYKDRVLTYSLEATSLPEKEFNAACQDFANLVIKMIGPRLYEEVCFLYGDEQTFVFNLVEYFNDKYESDEIRKSSINSLTDNDSEEQK